ncbi:MAG: hypothetical protein IT442_08440 [Phycisphaeraceae bacterium]|nr:hypothetical protein [Phycisphaeraceae bacterium]
MSTPHDPFISEPIHPTPGSFDAAAMAAGEPGLPARFTWRDTEYHVTELLEAWKSSSPESGSGELYLRRHWFKILAESNDDPPARWRFTLYCLRQAPKGATTPRAQQARWWLYTAAHITPNI